MDYKVKESFTWPALVDDWKTADAGKNKIKISAVAARTNTLSKNNRRYVEEELKASARTFVGQPVNVNHDSKRIIGNIDWAEFDDGELKVLATISKQPYVDLLRNKSTEIKGVSIQADYRYNICQKCGKPFKTDKAFESHMIDEHFIKNFEKQPFGMRGTGISLVLSPEEPGVSDTSLEVVEKAAQGFLQLAETIVKDKSEGKSDLELGNELPYGSDNVKEKKESKGPTYVKDGLKIGKSQITEKVYFPGIQYRRSPNSDGTCPVGYHQEGEWCEPNIPADMQFSEFQKSGKLVPNKFGKCSGGWHLEDGCCVPDKEVEVREPDQPKVLGEPFADYADHADCVAKNQDKEDPDAYCASIERQAKGEMKEIIGDLYQKLTEQKREFESILSQADENVDKLNMENYKLRQQQVTEQMTKKIWDGKQYRTLGEIVGDMLVNMGTLKAEFEKVKTAKTIAETSGNGERLQAIETRLDNLEHNLKKGQFKGKSKALELESSSDQLGEKSPYKT